MNYPYYHIKAKNTFLASRELLKLQWQKMQFCELIELRIEEASTIICTCTYMYIYMYNIYTYMYHAGL